MELSAVPGVAVHDHIDDNSMVAQNTCLQMCVIGRNTFIGAGSTFTDFNLLPARSAPWMAAEPESG